VAYYYRYLFVLILVRCQDLVQVFGAAVQARIEAREAARKCKDFAESDRIRDELLAQGIVLEDTPKGVVWKKRG
jgi:cysteinyl-tRNA synthetase